jgi:hypothetical protein
MLSAVHMMRYQMSNIHQFRLVLSNVNSQTENLEDNLYEAGCDDALINFKGNVVYLDFDREAETFEKALLSAIKNVEDSAIGAKVVSVAPDHLVSLSEIANRVSSTRQSVSLLALGKRGDNTFPQPVLKVGHKDPLWRWVKVVDWLIEKGRVNDKQMLDTAQIIEEINLALEMRDTGKSYKDISRYLH